MHIAFGVWNVLRAWGASIRHSGLRNVQNTLQPYILHNTSTVMYEVTDSCEHGYAPLSQRTRSFSSDAATKLNPTVLVLLHRRYCTGPMR